MLGTFESVLIEASPNLIHRSPVHGYFLEGTYNESGLIGDLDELDDDSVILSSQLALSVGARMGSVVEVYSPLLLEKMKNDEVMLPRELEVVGIFEVGHQQLDSSVVLVTLRTMQDLYGLGSSVHGITPVACVF